MTKDEPDLQAAQRANAALAAGDAFNARLWARILAAIEELRRQRPTAEAVN